MFGSGKSVPEYLPSRIKRSSCSRIRLPECRAFQITGNGFAMSGKASMEGRMFQNAFLPECLRSRIPNWIQNELGVDAYPGNLTPPRLLCPKAAEIQINRPPQESPSSSLLDFRALLGDKTQNTFIPECLYSRVPSFQNETKQLFQNAASRMQGIPNESGTPVLLE